MPKPIKFDPDYIPTEWLDKYTKSYYSIWLRQIAIDLIKTWKKVCEKENQDESKIRGIETV